MSEPVTGDAPLAVRGGDPHGDERVRRRRASFALWQAVEALLAAPGEPEALDRALESLRAAFDCEGVALHARTPAGAIEPWCALGEWRTTVGDLRDTLTVPLMRGRDRLGELALQGRPGQRFRAGQLGLVRAAAGALGAALGARLELERLRHLPGRDPITGLPDGRAFLLRLEEELGRARRHGPPVGLVTIELDHFDALRERYGTAAADAVLAEAALVLTLTLRGSDVVARLEDARFALLLPETDALPALRCAERVRRSLEEHRFARAGRVSATAGVAACPRDGVDVAELVDRAEGALAIARKQGRRRVAGLPGGFAH